MKRFLLIFFFLYAAYSNAQQSTIDSLQTLLRSAIPDTTTLTVLNELSWQSLKQGEYKQALKYAQDAVALANALDLPGENDKKASRLFKKAEARGYNNMGLTYCDQGAYDKGLYYHYRSLAIQKDIDDTRGISASYNNIGMVYDNMGVFDKAVEFYFKSLQLDEQNGDKAGVASSNNNIGNVYYYQGNLEKALEYFFKCLDISREINDLRSAANAYNNLGNIYSDQGELDKAIEFYLKSLEIDEQFMDKKGMGDSYNNLGAVYADKKDYEKAGDYYFKALSIEKEIGDQQGVSLTYNNIGDLYFRQNQIAEAKKFHLLSLDLAKKINALPEIMHAYSSLSTGDSASGNFKSAYLYHKLYTQTKDSIFNVESKEKTTRVQMLYESEKKDKEIQMLNKQQQTQSELAAAESRRQVIIIWFALSSFLLVLIFSVFTYKRFKLSQQQKNIIEIQKREAEQQRFIVDEKNKEITDSINYAKRIQYALLAHTDLLHKNLEEHFVLFKPKDIVSGDFYWATNKDDRFYLAVCDSTGHGVPGAFMSLLNISFLNEAITEKNIHEPDKILNHTRRRLIQNVSQEGAQDGMDGILFCFDRSNNTITYAAAQNTAVIVRDNSIIELQSDKMPVGKGEKEEPFTLQHLQYKQGDMLYVFTDGYADQFGGPKGKKFKYANLYKLFCKYSAEQPARLRKILERTFEEWRGDLEQVDDVCVLGIKL